MIQGLKNFTVGLGGTDTLSTDTLSTRAWT
jgi:hypothetical protein